MERLKDISNVLQTKLSADDIDFGFFIGTRAENLVFPQLGDISTFIFKDAEFKNVVFSEIPFFGADLGEASFVNCCFTDCSLARSGMYKTRFIQCVFSTTNFSNARLHQTVFERCILNGLNFKGAVLSKSIFKESILKGAFDCTLHQTDILDSVWDERQET